MASASYHYRRAEELAEVARQEWTRDVHSVGAATSANLAQVHATLALVAIQAEVSRGAVVMLDPRRPGGES